MNSSDVIKVHNVTKIYRLYSRSFDRVKEAFHPFGRIYHKKFYALHNVSLSLKKGEALGILGENGNGKSTLLKIIAGVIKPTEGQLKVNGRIAAILELTSNLKPEMTGKENIIYNLKLQGFTSKKIIKLKMKEIEVFAEIGEFINQPVKLYSSGMKARLGFAIATSVEPDILILDEVLAVGDFNFRQKCLARINAMRQNISILFVSHSMNDIRNFCDRAIVLEKGCIVFDGDPENTITYYLDKISKKEKQTKPKSLHQKHFYGDLFLNSSKISNIFHQWDRTTYSLEENMTLTIRFTLLYTPRKLVVGIPIWDKDGNLITSFNTDYHHKYITQDGQIHITLNTKCHFNPNEYICVVAIMDNNEYLYRGLMEHSFRVHPKERVFGYVTLEQDWKIFYNS